MAHPFEGDVSRPKGRVLRPGMSPPAVSGELDTAGGHSLAVVDAEGSVSSAACFSPSVDKGAW
ncbi:hypothetical protein ACFVX3_07365 [Rhodococcus erythropolis]